MQAAATMTKNQVETTITKPEQQQQQKQNEQSSYRALVIDSGPIIKFQANTLHASASSFYTVPGVLQEIKDAKARQQPLPFDLKVKEPSPESLTKIIEFARKTGDYPSLSSVDLQVLALVYELEQDGCVQMNHVRTTPKRMLGQRIKAMNNQKKKTQKKNNDDSKKNDEDSKNEEESKSNDEALNHFGEISEDDIEFDVEEDDDGDHRPEEDETKEEITPSSWAKLVNPTAKGCSQGSAATTTIQPFTIPKQYDENNSDAGQFSDAEDDEELNLDMNLLSLNTGSAAVDTDDDEENLGEFPSLQEALQVPYEDEDGDNNNSDEICPALLAKQESEEKRLEALQVKSNSGKQYQSFRKYRDLLKPKQNNGSVEEETNDDAPELVVVEGEEKQQQQQQEGKDNNDPASTNKTQSRIIMGQSAAGQNTMHEFEDDGEGWVTSTKDIRNMKSVGKLNPTTNPSSVLDHQQKGKKKKQGPPVYQRTACATTDFAMQNVLLQMNLELVSVDGMKIRRLKSWVQRCGACFKVYYPNSENDANKRMLFCAHCGSDMMQRVAASVDGSGRVRLHLKKGYQHNIRGTKFSLPKAGSNDRFQGDLLLREDQMMMRGAWNTKVKKSSAKKNKAVASLFGSDLAEHVGCHANHSALSSEYDIKVGFGRRNPNAATGGRERRGKKKKSGHKACGLRRY